MTPPPLSKAASTLLSSQAATGASISKAIFNLDKVGRENITLDVLKHRLAQLEKYWKTFYEKHQLIYEHREELKEDTYFTEDYFSDIENVYLTAKMDMSSRLAVQVADLQLIPETPANDAQGPSTAVSTTASSLPKLTLPRFDGRQEDWESFKELFTSMVRNVPTLTPVLKLQHLLSCLDGDAGRRLGNLQIVGANFDVAWKALECRYDNKRLRLAVQLNRLLGMPSAATKSVAEITRLLDTTNESMRALRSLGRPVDSWDDWFVQLIVFNLDPDTREDWEKSLEGVSTFPTYATLTTFLENRTKALDTAHCSDASTLQRNKVKVNNFSSKNTPSKNFSAHLSNNTSTNNASTKQKTSAKPGCAVCKGDHYIGYCPTLLQKNNTERLGLADRLRLCTNCLRAGHNHSACPSKVRCKHCQQNHHSVLHRFQDSSPGGNRGEFLPNGPRPALGKAGSTLNSHSTCLGRTTLLGTARVILQGKSGAAFEFRALIDPCSEGSFVSEEAAQALGLTKTPCQTSVTGVGGDITATSSSISTLSLKSRTDSSLFVTFSAVVLPRLSAMLPRDPVHLLDAGYLQGLEMADPDFANPGHVDCILGGELYPCLIQEGLRRGTENGPVAQKTRLGWILTGPTAEHSITANMTLRCFHAGLDLSTLLRRFWEIEEISGEPPLSPAEEECERHFQTTHSRDGSGRYVVRLPFRAEPSLPNTRSVALGRLLSIERRLSKDAELRQAYEEFLHDYQRLGHMEPVTAEEGGLVYYLLHHAVCTRKLRVVFSGEPLNDLLHAGPKLQKDITTVLTRWRLHQYVFTADIVKMFRQIRIHPEDASWQRILWRTSPERPVRDYQLTTVTYGTACAPYLALRVLLQLAEDEQVAFPLGARILRENFYVDDALAGADTLDGALEAKAQLQGILAAAGMQLDKWAANHPTLLQDVTSAASPSDPSFDTEDVVPTLGLRWSPTADAFRYQLQQPGTAADVSKRSMLGEIARLYDPLGLLAPVVVRAKVLLQQLWVTGKDWDAPVDDRTRQQWEEFRRQLPLIQSLRIPRWFGSTTSSAYQIHGFSDASEKAYAAAVYYVRVNDDKTVQATLIQAKSKVAPIKAISVPRLELCGALLLSQLVKRVQGDLGESTAPVYCWSDSQVVLAWLKGTPNTWKTFVANRVSEILTTLPTAHWEHVRSALNPADHATRGLTPSQLQTSQLWWEGPFEIFRNPDRLLDRYDYETVIERRLTTTTFHAAERSEETIETLVGRFGSMQRLVRVFAFMYRWQSNYGLGKADRPSSILSARELETARCRLIAAVQAHHYPRELLLLRQGKSVHKSSPLRRLLPFLDCNGMLRVGGRLQYSFLAQDEKHPILVPKGSHLADLLIRDAHLVTLHGGPQLIQSQLLRGYWIPQSRNRIRMVFRRCVRCCRFQGRTFEQQMAPIPAERLTPARPFTITGVDYAGPFAIRTSKGRGQRSFKGYVAVFTCFVTRAVHIEVVSDYTSKTFLAAFRRFVARRGLPRAVYSDNGTTFQGADSELRRLFEEASAFSQEVAEAIHADGVIWGYIPPRAPHFGGLWEAAVKSFKHHLKRVLGDATLTFEEFSTLTTCIEACLNSRPLSPLSTDPSDVAALTPGHFLIGTALLAPPEPPSSDSNVSGLQRWQLVTLMHQHFWRRWHKEVLHHLQQRSKWLEPDRTPALGDLVLIKDDLQPPLKWPLARIEALHPGPDGLHRVATLRTSTTTLKRPLVKVVILPVNEAAAAFHAPAVGPPPANVPPPPPQALAA